MARALAVMLLAAGPAAAQDSNVVVAPAPPPPKAGDIGPGELSNFSLHGTVTQPADRPAVAAPPPASTVPAPTRAAPIRDTRPAARGPVTAPAELRGKATQDLFRRPPTLPDASAQPTVGSLPATTGEPIVPAAPPASDGSSIFPWLAVLLAIAGGGLLWFGRQRRHGQRYATAGHAPLDVLRKPEPAVRLAPRPDPTPAAPPSSPAARRPLPTTLMPPPAPPVQPRPDPVIPGGIVSTGLRPWIDVELSPDRALLDEQGAAIAFEVVLYNSGSAAARDVMIEAKLLNAGTSQDMELSAFFTAETALSDPIPQIAPYARIPLRSAVRLPREAISEYDYEGRKLFMPLVAISVRYRWSSGDGQSAAGFLVGQGGEGQDKLAPLRVDRGARSWKSLGARRYEKGVRR